MPFASRSTHPHTVEQPFVVDLQQQAYSFDLITRKTYGRVTFTQVFGERGELQPYKGKVIYLSPNIWIK